LARRQRSQAEEVIRKYGGNRTARWVRRALGLVLAPVVAVGGYILWTYHGPAPEREIYQGIFYCCEALPDLPQCGGLVHWVRADLNVPGVSIFVTPLNADAVSHGWQYRLQWTMSAVSQQHLAAAVNGTMFATDARWFRWPGDLARSGETVVADHVVSHIDPNCFLMWWDDALVAHLGGQRPPSAVELAGAKWGIGSQMPALWDGKVNSWAGVDVDHRTLIGADPARRLIWIACFDRASGMFAGGYLRDLGATIAVTVDGGTSTAMAIGSEAVGVRGGRVVGDFRPVATQFGFRALPLSK
jgi:Phosphodiester glycosidase